MFQLLNDVYIIFLACLQPLQTLFYVRNPIMSELRAVNYFIYDFNTGLRTNYRHKYRVIQYRVMRRSGL